MNKVTATFKCTRESKGLPTIVVEMGVTTEVDCLVAIEETLKRMDLGAIFRRKDYTVNVAVEVSEWPHGG